MQDISSRWLPGLQEQHQQLHGEDMDVYTWLWLYTRVNTQTQGMITRWISLRWFRFVLCFLVMTHWQAISICFQKGYYICWRRWKCLLVSISSWPRVQYLLIKNDNMSWCFLCLWCLASVHSLNKMCATWVSRITLWWAWTFCSLWTCSVKKPHLLLHAFCCYYGYT